MQTHHQSHRTPNMHIPPGMRLEIERIIDQRISQVHVTRHDFTELKNIVASLGQDVGKLTVAVGELREAQKSTDQRVKELTEAQKSTDQRVKELTEAQMRTEKRLDSLEETQAKGFKSLSDQISALGGRWGIYNEATFRNTLRGIFAKMEGVEVREGEYGGRQVDVIIRNGEHILLEITSRMHARDIDNLYASADDYQAREGIEPLLMVATSYVSPRLMEKIINLERKIDIFSYEGE